MLGDRTTTTEPILYSFRRCPYAMRARMAIASSGQSCSLREVVLSKKPREMILISPKGTVPVIVLPEGDVIEESLQIMYWALEKNDPERWLKPLHTNPDGLDALIAENDGPFKHNLDQYKYSSHYTNSDPLYCRDQGLEFLEKLNLRLNKTKYLFGNEFSVADAAISPFVRQFANTDRKWFDTRKISQVHRWLKEILNSDRFLNVMYKYPAWESGGNEVVFPPT